MTVYAFKFHFSLIPLGLIHCTLQSSNFCFTTLNTRESDKNEIFKNSKKEKKELLGDYCKLKLHSVHAGLGNVRVLTYHPSLRVQIIVEIGNI